MSAPAKEPQPLGSTTGKREDVRICVRCGKEMQMVGRNAKYCLLCRGEVYRERARAYRSSHHASADTGACPSAQKIRFCQRCGCEIPNATNSQKWCPDCKMAVMAQQSRQSYIRRHEAAQATKQLICQRCGQSFDVSSAGYARAKYCPEIGRAHV